jgi:hypothetical protein
VPASKKQRGSERAACRQAGGRQRQRFGRNLRRLGPINPAPTPNPAGPTAKVANPARPHHPAGDLGLDWTHPTSRGGAQADTPRTSWEFPDAAGGSATRAPAARSVSADPSWPQRPLRSARRRAAAARVFCETEIVHASNSESGRLPKQKARALFAAAATRPKRRVGRWRRCTPSARRPGSRQRQRQRRTASTPIGRPAQYPVAICLPAAPGFSLSRPPHRASDSVARGRPGLVFKGGGRRASGRLGAPATATLDQPAVAGVVRRRCCPTRGRAGRGEDRGRG